MPDVTELLTNSAAEWQILAEVALAMVLGGVIGFEREAANKPAGFRTHMLVAGSAALLVGMAFALVERSVRLPAHDAIAADPIRILQAITIGVSFLGAGTIVRGRRPNDVQGLTTAASLLMSSGIGIAVALRQLVLAVGLSLLVAVVLRLVGQIERRMGGRPASSVS
jgi:putative Mg2+ transporter-C (MgtC) family protein